MTDEQIIQWKTERDIARAIADPESRKVALEKVYDHRDEMQMICIAHQSARVKAIEATTSQLAKRVDSLSVVDESIKAELKPLKDFKAEADTARERFKGARFGFGLAMLLVGKFGWDAVNAIWQALTSGAAH